jgi:hypothetical protein
LPAELGVAQALDQSIRSAIRRIDLIQNILEIVRELRHGVPILTQNRRRAEGLVFDRGIEDID